MISPQPQFCNFVNADGQALQASFYARYLSDYKYFIHSAVSHIIPCYVSCHCDTLLLKYLVHNN